VRRWQAPSSRVIDARCADPTQVHVNPPSVMLARRTCGKLSAD